LFTGKGREEVVIEALNSGADSYLQKGGKALPQYAELEHRIFEVVQRHRGKEALLESKTRFEQLTEQGGIVIWEIDADGLFKYVSGASEAVWGGYHPDELVGKKFFYDLTPETERETFKAKVFEMIKRKERFVNLENPMMTKDGRVKWVSTNGIPLLNDDGTLRVYRGSDTDITDRKRAEATLWTMAARNDAILAAVPDIMTEVDDRKRITWVNQPGLQFYGEDVIGREASYYFEGEQETYTKVQPLFDGGDEIIHLESWQRRKDGQKRLLSWSCKTLKDEEGRVTGVLSSARDITEAKRAEQECEVVHAIGEAINTNASLDEMLQVIHNNIKKVMYAENCYIALWDASTGIMSFPFFVDQIDPKLAPRANQKGLTEYVLRTARPLLLNPELLNELVRQNEVEIIGASPESWLGVPLSIQSKTIGVLVVQSYGSGNNYMDTEKDLLVTIGNQAALVIERKRVADALQQSEKRYRLLVNSAAEAIIVAQDAMIRLVNPVTVAMIGFSEQELMSKPFPAFIHPDDRAMVVENYQKRMRGEAVPARYAFRFQAKDGRAIWVEISAVLIDWEGRPATLNFLTDITERKLAEDALRQANAKLGILNTITRHDINNQMTVVKGFLELCKQREKDPELARYIERISHAAANVLEQIDFTKDYQELGIHAPIWASFGRKAVNALAILHLSGVALEDWTEGVEILADPLVEKVFYNLIDNSVRHGGHVTRIKISSQRVGDSMLIVYEDDGVGISAEDKKRLFEKGFGKNTGYGLFLIREILAITGITITERGQAGKGVRFEMLVPSGTWRLSLPK
ncbi:MAG: PAS domain S-box protein, partial [Deltaproteobacteria bacterium]|nr:PAS domain S-box protein [Deltaproteobacteria bacterium]